MGRIHLFEFEDLAWFPQFLRNYETDFLSFLSNKTGIFKPILPVMHRGLKASSSTHIIDLGSGGGGPILSLNSQLQRRFPNLKIFLTDYYPNIAAFNLMSKKAPNLEYIEKPIDARNVPKNLRGLRTLFLVFHHFKPDDARQILQDAIYEGDPIAILEGQERSLSSIIAMILSPLSVLLTTPFIGPFKFGRIIFTYLIPIVPLVVMWDGIVSSLRTYSVKEMKELVNGLDNTEGFNWEMGRKRSGPGMILYLLGTPKQNSSASD